MKEIVRLEHITKTYPNGILANDDVTLSFDLGEICAIAGENGAGKSTIMKILYGVEAPDSGEIFIDGQKAKINSPKDANKYGIGMVFQHFMLVNEFKVYENVFFGIEKKNRLSILKKKEMSKDTKALCEKYQMDIDPEAVTGSLSVGLAQKVEILKVLQRGARIIILDEPTAVLTPQETTELFKQIRLLKESGCTIIIITHKLKEIKELCDRVIIMKNGHSLGSYEVSKISEEEISSLMVGGKVTLGIDKTPIKNNQTAIEVTNLTIMRTKDKPAVNNVSFQAKKGEILCLAGVEGNGQEETIQALAGIVKGYQGKIAILGTDIAKLDIKKVRDLHVSYIPEDRMKTGADLQASIFDNYISVKHAEKNKLGFIDGKHLKAETEANIEKYQIKGSLKEPISMLSGGNMQKVVIARELGDSPYVVLADQPTRGVDIGASSFIHQKLIELRNNGNCLIVVSADLNEVFALADRIIVFHDGSISAEISDPSSVNEEQLGRYMLGLEKQKGENHEENN
jgi:simple sugar transport system ATP-binding protein